MIAPGRARPRALDGAQEALPPATTTLSVNATMPCKQATALGRPVVLRPERAAWRQAP